MYSQHCILLDFFPPRSYHVFYVSFVSSARENMTVFPENPPGCFPRQLYHLSQFNLCGVDNTFKFHGAGFTF